MRGDEFQFVGCVSFSPRWLMSRGGEGPAWGSKQSPAAFQKCPPHSPIAAITAFYASFMLSFSN